VTRRLWKPPRASELLARFSEGFLSAAGGKLRDEKADQLYEPPFGEFDCFQFRGDAVDVGGAAGAGSTAAAPPLGRDREEAGLSEPVEAAARDVGVGAERERDLVRGERILLRPRVEKHPAKLGIAGRCQAVERHSGETLPAARLYELAQRLGQCRKEQGGSDEAQLSR
jgi:hypothetical protein